MQAWGSEAGGGEWPRCPQLAKGHRERGFGNEAGPWRTIPAGGSRAGAQLWCQASYSSPGSAREDSAEIAWVVLITGLFFFYGSVQTVLPSIKTPRPQAWPFQLQVYCRSYRWRSSLPICSFLSHSKLFFTIRVSQQLLVLFLKIFLHIMLGVTHLSLSQAMPWCHTPASLCPHPVSGSHLALASISLLSSPEKQVWPSGIYLLFPFFRQRHSRFTSFLARITTFSKKWTSITQKSGGTSHSLESLSCAETFLPNTLLHSSSSIACSFYRIESVTSFSVSPTINKTPLHMNYVLWCCLMATFLHLCWFPNQMLLPNRFWCPSSACFALGQPFPLTNFFLIESVLAFNYLFLSHCKRDQNRCKRLSISVGITQTSLSLKKKKKNLGQNESRGGWFVVAQEPRERGERRGQIPH